MLLVILEDDLLVIILKVEEHKQVVDITRHELVRVNPGRRSRSLDMRRLVLQRLQLLYLLRYQSNLYRVICRTRQQPLIRI